MSDGMSDGYRMEREAAAADDREMAAEGTFDTRFPGFSERLIDTLREYRQARREYFHIDKWEEKNYPNRKPELLRKMQSLKLVLIPNLESLAKMLTEKM